MTERIRNQIDENSAPRDVIISSYRLKENPKCEYLSNDIVDVDSFKPFSSLYIAKFIVGVNRVETRSLFVSPLTMNQKIFTIFQTIATVAVLFVASEVFVTNAYVYEELHYWARQMALLCGFNHVNSILHARFVYNENNTTFQLKMQEIDRLMGVAHNKQINGILSRIISLKMAFLGVLSAALVLLSFFGGFYMFAMVAATIWSLAANILESTHCSVVLVYLFIRVRFINAVILNYVEGVPLPCAEPPRPAVIPTTAVLRLIAAQAHDLRAMDTDIHLKLLLDCFQDLEDLFKFPVAVLFISYFAFAWQCVQFTIFGLKYRAYKSVEWALMPILLFNGVVMTSALTYFFEKFFREVRETKRLAIVIMSRHHDGPLWAKARRMHRLAGLRAPRFSVCGLWQLDAAFLVRFFDAVSAMIVTELQFRL